MPSTPAAGRANLTQVWVSSTRYILRKDRQVALVFDREKVDILMHRATYQSALHYFHAFIAAKNQNGGVTAEIGQVNGRPALVIWPGTNYSHSNPAVVNFWRNGVLISIYSNTEPFSSFGLAGLKDVDDFGQLPGGFTMPRVGTPARDLPVPKHPRSG